MDLTVWACPVCHSLLEKDGDGLRCRREERVFESRAGMPMLVVPEEVPLLRAAEGYAAAWSRLGWAAPEATLLNLPYVRDRAYRRIWEPKTKAFELLLTILGPARNRKAADVGAGTGWLAYRLAQAGFRSYATDLSADGRIGLGAAAGYDATPHPFERALATLTHWPFHNESLDTAICNASLHYVSDPRPVFEEAFRVLRPNGVFVVMNEPIHTDARSAERAGADFRARLRQLGGSGPLVEGYRHFVTENLETSMREVFQVVRKHVPEYGPWFRLTRRAKGFGLRMELASFPLYEAIRGRS